MRQRWKWVIPLAVLAVAVSVVAIAHDASGATEWKNFASGSARARFGEWPSVSLDGTPPATFSAVRFKVGSGADGQKVDVWWDLTCWKGYNYASRSGSKETVTPFIKQFTLPMTNPDYCSLSVSAFLERSGYLYVKLQHK